jgi:predicted MFS family arabinose efflux permease
MKELITPVRLALGTAAVLGLGRFALGPLLPAMRLDLGWTLSEAGGLATANGVGYLVGAITAPALVRLSSATWVFRAGMIVTAVSLAATGASGEYAAVSAARIVAGFAGALVFIAGGVIAARAASGYGSATPIVIFFSGTGLGIALSGLVLPQLLDGRAELWDAGWLALGILAGLATLGSWTPAALDGGPVEIARPPEPWPRRHVWPVAGAYLLFGAGYITYLTFLDAYQAGHDASAGVRGSTWALLGLGVLASPRLWSTMISRWPSGRAVAVLLAVISAAAALPLVIPGLPAMIASAVIFGATFMAVPSAVTALLSANVPPHARTAALAAFTVVFSIGQAIGPWLAGAIADRTATAATLGWTVAVCAVAGLLSAIHRQPEGPTGSVPQAAAGSAERSRS